MNEVRISAFLLERYHIGEVTPDEKRQVEEALEKDETLRTALADLARVDSEFFQRFPKESVFSGKQELRLDNTRQINVRRPKKVQPFVWGLCAAALVFVAALPVFILQRANLETGEYTDRVKGVERSSVSADSGPIELSVYKKENVTGEVVRLSDKDGIQEGSTIQLAYFVSNAGFGEKYGVIFSIDGRAFVTMHFPYTPWQNTLLVSGRAVPLDEAFTLDDAPDYEIFIFVAGDSPIDIRSILSGARQLASQIEGKPNEAESLAAAMFKGFEVKVFTLVKE